MMINNRLGIYIHIPFCVKKCNYCDFLSFPDCGEEIKTTYVKALINEINAYASLYGKSGSPGSPYADTVFFGGGTPSVLKSSLIYDILQALNKGFAFAKKPELTIECNPGTIDLTKLNDYKSMGINRLSIGLQSCESLELALLGRIHSFEDFSKGFELARKCGFDNINVDIMSALPGQTVSSYKNTLCKTLEFCPEHISAYSLIIEEGTPFFDIYSGSGKKPCPPLPDEDAEREMYYMTDAILKEKGYRRYEISNYSLKGFECRHNLGYWERKNYLGFGLGASSFIKDTRFKNISKLGQYIDLCSSLSLSAKNNIEYYIKEIIDFNNLEKLNKEEAMAEFMFLGLRKTDGIKKSGFYRLFGESLYTVYGSVIEKHKKNGLLTEEGDRLFLSAKGMDLSNYVFSDFII